MSMLGNKIGVQNGNLALLTKERSRETAAKTPALLWFAGVFLCLFPGCVMTRAEGETLSRQVRDVEGEMAKLQRVRHEMEVLLSGHMKGLVDRVAKLEGQLVTMRDALVEGTTKSAQLLSELEMLRGQLEEAQNRFQTLEQDQRSLAQSHLALKQAHKKIPLPPTKKEHFEMAKKLYGSSKFDDAIYLFDEFVRIYENDKDLVGQSYYTLGEIYKKLADNEKETAEIDKFSKKAIISFQKLVEMNYSTVLREEALFKMGIILKTMGNREAAMAAFNELLSEHKNSKRAAEAKKQLATLKAEL